MFILYDRIVFFLKKTFIGEIKVLKIFMYKIISILIQYHVDFF